MMAMNMQTGRLAQRWIVSAAIASTLALSAAACGGGDSGPELSEAGARGRSLSTSSGCAGCHGSDGQGGVGPTWQGLAGSERELADGTIVIADDDYLIRSIKEPGADLLADFAVQMPRNNLDDQQVADIVAYINDLADVTSGG
jgi:cytochrome c oxidase subunit 2